MAAAQVVSCRPVLQTHPSSLTFCLKLRPGRLVAKAPMQHLCDGQVCWVCLSAVPLPCMPAGMRQDRLLHHPE